MKLTKLLIMMCVKKQSEYKTNFILLCISVAPIHLIQMLFSWIISKKFNGFGSWTGWNLIFLYGILLTSYSWAQILFRQFRYLEDLIINGEMDIYFLKPQPIIYSLVFYNLSTMEIFSQLLPSTIILFFSCIHNGINWNMAKILVLIGAILGGTIIQMAIFLLIGCVAFWTTRSSDLESIYYAFKEFLNYPLHIYGKKIVAFLTFVFPLAFINYYPSLYILDHNSKNDIIHFMTIPVAIILFFLAYSFWKISINHYNSAGS